MIAVEILCHMFIILCENLLQNVQRYTSPNSQANILFILKVNNVVLKDQGLA